MGQETSLPGPSLSHPSTQPVNAIVKKVHLSFPGLLSTAPARLHRRQLLPRGLSQAARPESFTAAYLSCFRKTGLYTFLSLCLSPFEKVQLST